MDFRITLDIITTKIDTLTVNNEIPRRGPIIITIIINIIISSSSNAAMWSRKSTTMTTTTSWCWKSVEAVGVTESEELEWMRTIVADDDGKRIKSTNAIDLDRDRRRRKEANVIVIRVLDRARTIARTNAIDAEDRDPPAKITSAAAVDMALMKGWSRKIR